MKKLKAKWHNAYDDLKNYSYNLLRDYKRWISMNNRHNNPSLGICIPVWNRGDLFKICIDSLLSNIKGLDVTIWIFDNGSDAKTRKIVEDLRSERCRINKIFLPENMGIPYVANIFAKLIQENCDYAHYKTPDYIMIMDADAYFKKPVKDLVDLCAEDYQIGLISGHDSIEHDALDEKILYFHGKKILLKEKELERMITMVMRSEEFLRCYPFPHYRNRDVDWEIALWNPNSMKMRNRRIFVACDYVLHLGIDTSTWDTSKQTLASEQEIKEVTQILKQHRIVAKH